MIHQFILSIARSQATRCVLDGLRPACACRRHEEKTRKQNAKKSPKMAELREVAKTYSR